MLDRTEDAAWKSFRNLGERVQIVLPEELNAYDVLVNDWLVFTTATLPGQRRRRRLTAGVAATTACEVDAATTTEATMTP